eukprot:gene24848-33335_t
MSQRVPYVPKQNLSGHITIDVQQSRFIQETNRKIQNIERKREFGTLIHRPTRNPLNAEVTPRVSFKGFQFKPPTPEPVPQKWVYPEGDWGLMSKFTSQKEIYDEIFEKQKHYHETVEEFRRIKELNEIKIKAEMERLRNKKEDYIDPYNVKDDVILVDKSRFEAMKNIEDDLDIHISKNKFHKSHAHAAKNSLNRFDESGPLTSSSSLKITQFKELGKKHPEVLAEWRADRAAKFAEKTIRKENKIFAEETLKSQQLAASLNMSQLKDELDKTEDALARQQLKIALHSGAPKMTQSLRGVK